MHIQEAGCFYLTGTCSSYHEINIYFYKITWFVNFSGLSKNSAFRNLLSTNAKILVLQWVGESEYKHLQYDGRLSKYNQIS